MQCRNVSDLLLLFTCILDRFANSHTGSAAFTYFKNLLPKFHKTFPGVSPLKHYNFLKINYVLIIILLVLTYPFVDILEFSVMVYVATFFIFPTENFILLFKTSIIVFLTQLKGRGNSKYLLVENFHLKRDKYLCINEQKMRSI